MVEVSLGAGQTGLGGGRRLQVGETATAEWQGSGSLGSLSPWKEFLFPWSGVKGFEGELRGSSLGYLGRVRWGAPVSWGFGW